jgi:hypothetical protein
MHTLVVHCYADEYTNNIKKKETYYNNDETTYAM